eukprot:CAMPEP_0201151992 /NCGR_PEP_ID=MMETSP0851-20130426/12799_1 /ASSEMBLY_ACC=CAM_ASM_000631 /TAXON_ID=183588 /ORGANISM="Pseudo-nitzschia fraudulenta, Strain WWA7" /LENGTH=552 /DNA_ID=CAMNT_0047428947 /DNA_START=52 /DNA_END=1710 /DNA_ORIENTATION=+
MDPRNKKKSRRRNRRVSLLVVPALLSLSSCVYFGPTSLAFTHSTKRRQHPTSFPSSSSPSSSRRFYSSSVVIRSESEASQSTNDGKNNDNDDNKNNEESSVSSVTLRSGGSGSVQQQPQKNEKHRRHDHTRHDNNPNSEWLKKLGLPRGLRDTLLDNIEEVCSQRIWIIDNSGSMKMMDGHEILADAENNNNKSKNNPRQQQQEQQQQQKTESGTNQAANDKVLVPRSGGGDAADGDTTRWAELQETVKVHALLLSVLGAPTDFRLLNEPSNGGPRKFRVGYDNNNHKHKGHSPPPQLGPVPVPSLPSLPAIFRRKGADSNRAEKIMNRNKPKGKTPLHEAVLDVRKDVVRMLPQLRADGTKVTIVICTDGSATGSGNNGEEATTTTAELDPNQELEAALESLKGLPVNVVIRLCTDYGEVVDFYNGLDERMGDSAFLDVVDDYEAEAAQVYGQNPWLNYALVLHRMRELGLQGSTRLLDSLDQRPFTGDEISEFAAMLFGTTPDLLPDPLCDWENFVGEVDRLQHREQMHYNPSRGEVTPWIDVEELLAMQ